MKILFIIVLFLFNDEILLKKQFSQAMRENPRKALHIPCIFPTTQLSGASITSLYGLRKHPIYGGFKHHNGIDIAVSGAEVVATASGVVKTAKYSKSYGYYVEIDHLNGYQTLYGHLSTIFVEPGQKVEITTVLGVSGSSGNVTGEHIHYEVKHYDKYLNPLYTFLLLYDSLHR